MSEFSKVQQPKPAVPISPVTGRLLQRQCVCGNHTAVTTELSRLIRGLLPTAMSASGIVPSLRAGTVQLGHDNNPALLGQQIVRAVYGGNGR